MAARLKKTLLVLTLCAIGTALGFAAARYGAPKQNSQPMLAPTITLMDFEGHERNLDEWKGKLRLVNFWASWCAPCLNEMPMLVAAQKQYGARGLQIIGPALDEAAPVRKIASELKLNYPYMADFSSADSAMMLLGNPGGGLPYSVFIDSKGRIVKTILGGLSQNELDSLVKANLPQSP